MKLNEHGRQDIRKLLKRFGIEADKSVTAYLGKHPDYSELRVRLTLEDITQYDDAAQVMEPLVIDGSIRS